LRLKQKKRASHAIGASKHRAICWSGERSISCPSIQEYLLISSEFPLVEVFRREKQGFWSLYTLGVSDTIELHSLGLRFPVSDVYENTSFLEASNA
jgi:hypothetical protein